MATDILLDRNTHDIDISSQGLVMIEDNSAVVAQRVKIALLLRYGEWFANTTVGIPYLQFSKVKNSKAFADSVLSSAITAVEGVENLESYTSTNSGTRNLQVDFTIEAASGEIIDLYLEV